MFDSNVTESLNHYRQAHFMDENGYQPQNHNFLREDVVLQMHEHLQVFRKAFSQMGWGSLDLPSKRVLEVGCAWGLRINQLLGFNLDPANLFGIDIQEGYIQQARRLNPSITFNVMSATDIKYPDKCFDFTFACVSLQAMLDDTVISQSLSEMCRVSNDFILIVDIFDPKYVNERNGSIYLKGVDPKHIKNLETTSIVEKVYPVGTFWTTNSISWKFFRTLKKIGLSTLAAYAIAINLLASHSHSAYLIKLKRDNGK